MFKLNDILLSAQKTANKCIWAVKKNSPKLLMGAGLIGSVVGCVLACRATAKSVPVVNDAKIKIEKVKADVETNTIPETDGKKEIKVIKKETAKTVGKNFILPTIVFGGSIVAEICGFETLYKRFTGVCAAYAAFVAKTNRYRKQVAGELGSEKEADIWAGKHEEEREFETVDEDGNTIKDTVMVEVFDDDDYTAIFDESNPAWEKGEFLMNLNSLRIEQDNWTKILKARAGKPVYLNEIRHRLFLPKTEAGQVVGWRWSEDPNHRGDNRIDFGIDALIEEYEGGRHIERPGEEPTSIPLNFNVDGLVLFAQSNKTKMSTYA